MSILALDIGTTYIKLVTYEESTLEELKFSRFRTPTIIETVKQSNRACSEWEIEPVTLWSRVEPALLEHIKQAEMQDKPIRAMGLSVLRNCVVLWERDTGRTLGNIVLWNDERCFELTRKVSTRLPWKVMHAAASVFSPLNNQIASFSKLQIKHTMVGPKLHWLLNNTLEEEGLISDQVIYSGIDSWIMWRLSHGRITNFCMDETLAATTGLYNIFARKWSRFLCRMHRIPKHVLPNVARIGNCLYGEYLSDYPLVKACMGDCQASLIGKHSTDVGHMSLILGTAAIAVVITDRLKRSLRTGYVPQIGCQLSNGTDIYEPLYYIERLYPHCSEILEMALKMGLVEDYSEIDKRLPQTDRAAADKQLMFCHKPGRFTFEREGSDDDVVDVNKESKEDLLEAMVESVAFGAFRIMEKQLESGEIKNIRICGGCTQIKFLRQLVIDLVFLKCASIVVELDPKHTSAIGIAAFLAWQDASLRPTILNALKRDLVICKPRERRYQETIMKRYLKWRKTQRKTEKN